MAVRFTWQPESILEGVKALFGRFQFFKQLLPPGWMGEIPRSDHIDPFPSGPQIQMFGNTVSAGCPGIAGVNMQIRQKHPVSSLS